MNDIVFRMLAADDLHRVSAQIAESYKAAYRNMMSDSYLDSLGDDHWVPILQGALSRGDTCLLAEAEGQVVGSAVFGRSAQHPAGADLHAIYLSPHCIGQGLGHRLYLETEQAMQAQGYHSSTLEVLTDNHRAIQFYLDHGYATADTFTVHENDMVLTCHTMKKQLS